MLVMVGAPGGVVSVVTISASEAGPSRFFVKARIARRYLVKEPAREMKVFQKRDSWKFPGDQK
jgi:hypothetical protein